MSMHFLNEENVKAKKKLFYCKAKTKFRLQILFLLNLECNEETLGYFYKTSGS